MPDYQNLFQLSPERRLSVETIGGKVPVVIVDGFYRRPDELRAAALTLQFQKPAAGGYPGKLARIPPNPSLRDAVDCVAQFANSEFLPRAPIRQRGELIAALRVVDTDFAVIDMHPDELQGTQRKPHIDPVPVFGLVYLNHEERGGTLFFEQIAEAADDPAPGYPNRDKESFEFLGKIEAKFNRLAIYPGFVPHSGEITGDWIMGEERFTNPRLTQRFIFRP
jgi:hypothetical protein